LIVSGSVLADVFRTSEEPETGPRYNIAPTQSVPILRTGDDNARTWAEARWGLIPSWAKDQRMGARMINARAETVASKPVFRSALTRRRCLVPTTGFFEWRRTGSRKQPYFICFVDRRPFAFAGLWELWKSDRSQWIESFTIITTEPNEVVRPLHDRMPVIVAPEDYTEWIDAERPVEPRLGEILAPYPHEEMEAFPVSTRVNSVANDDEGCIARVEQMPLFCRD
jgi:putative SOS response-associated peptidase YedK